VDSALKIEPRPILLAGLFKRWGQLGPAEIPPKRIFTVKDCSRRAVRDNIPFSLPPAHPFNPLMSLRVTSALLGTEYQDQLVTAFFRASWVESRDISSIHVVREVLEEVGVDSPEDTIRLAAKTEMKKTLQDNTRQATEELGVFGVPSWVVEDGELFWGDDQLENIFDYMAGKDPLLDPSAPDIKQLLELPRAADRHLTFTKLAEAIIPGQHFKS